MRTFLGRSESSSVYTASSSMYTINGTQKGESTLNSHTHTQTHTSYTHTHKQSTHTNTLTHAHVCGPCSSQRLRLLRLREAKEPQVEREGGTKHSNGSQGKRAAWDRRRGREEEGKTKEEAALEKRRKRRGSVRTDDKQGEKRNVHHLVPHQIHHKNRLRWKRRTASEENA